VFKALRNLLDARATPGASVAGDEHSLQLATAVLLIEVMRADGRFEDEEKQTVLKTLRTHFNFADDELAELYELAEQRSIASHDLYGFTERLNAAFDEPSRVRILEQLWTVAWADGHADDHESHLLRRMADLLHVRHGDAIAAKLRAGSDARAR
jgi:uncharacterized tellurite resistance protein B-like protein